MRNKFRLLLKKEEALLTKEQSIKYFEQKQQYYKKAPINVLYVGIVNSIRGYRDKKGPWGVINIAKKQRTFEIVYLNDLEVPTEGYIVATNHKSFNDIPMLVEVVPEPFHLLAANDVKLPPIAKVFFKLIGCIEFSRSKPNEKSWALEHFSKIVAKKGNIGAFYPEAVNNFVDPNIVYPFWPGIIDAAKNTGKSILPVATYEREGRSYVKYGKPFIVNAWDDRDQAAKRLEDIMVTLLYEIKETFPTLTREEVIEAYEPPNLVGKGALTYKPEYERQFVYRRTNPYSHTGEREKNYEEVFGNLLGEKTVPKTSEQIKDLSYTEYADYDITNARKKLTEKLEAERAILIEMLEEKSYDKDTRIIKKAR